MPAHRPHGGRPHHAPERPRQPPAPLPARLPAWPDAVSIVLRPGTATPPLAGHPWVFSGAIAHVQPGPATAVEPGVRCALFDQHARYLGCGYYNPQSQIAVRLIDWAADALEPETLPALADLVHARIAAAVQLRRDLGLPGADTDAFRLCNAEGDLLGGVTIDQYGDGAVVQLSTAGAWRLRAAIGSALSQAGLQWWAVRVPADVHPSEGLVGGASESHGPVPAALTVRMGGVAFGVEPGSGQKTGLYCDQRDNHLAVAALCKGRFVVDAFCHVGGFGLHAAKAGAAKVLCVDASQKAVDAVLANAALNGLAVGTQCGDAVHTLRQWHGAADADKPSLVVIDPPKYATKAAALDGATKKYQALNAAAMQAVQAGGWLVTCSCSGLLEPPAFLRMIGMAAVEAGVAVQLCQLRGPGLDHPTAAVHAEGRYLKVAIVRVLPKR